ncbi:hypothetical protein [Piscinibacter sp. XHJ-5]|uniref:hypothetical protein n=1 Tax=Piscinibacter sp. XHJ-5 TaxID=3037797 RepID=UPI002452FAED|nr:hypothetical protein [Piscinibacter sp. XHJ-5]
MATLWPWLAIAGLGALHGLSPANGWMFAAAWAAGANDRSQVRRALMPIALGHAAAVALVAWATAKGASMDRAQVQGLAGALLVAGASFRWLRGTGRCTPIATQACHVGLALWSFLMATAHGAGMMLVPALVPLCLADNPARELTASGSMAVALAAVGVHTAAMLATTGLIAAGVCRGVNACVPRMGGNAVRQWWTLALAVTGVMLMMLC